MNPEIKKRWIEALRSGEYKNNNKTYLRTKKGFSAYGVLCDLYSKESNYEWRWDFPTAPAMHFVNSFCSTPAQVSCWAKLTQFQVDKKELYRRPFTEIADFIEKNF